MIQTPYKYNKNILTKLNSTTNPTIQLEDEKAILTMILGDTNNKANYIVTSLEVGMFVNHQCREIFSTLKDIQKCNFTPNLTNFLSVTDNEDLRELASKLADNYITNINCKFFINRIRNSFFERSIVSATSCEEARQILEMQKTFVDIDTFVNDKDIEDELMSSLDENKELLTLGMPTVNRTVGSLQGGDVMVLAGGTSMGKTCMALNFVDRIRRTKKVLMFSLEMSAMQLVSRICCMNLDIDAFDLRNKTVSAKQKADVKSYLESGEATKNLKIVAKKNLTVSEIRKICENTNFDLIVIDYLGLIKPEGFSKRYEAVSDNSRNIKLLAMELNKPIILLHQINRDFMQREDKRPQLSDLRDSGNIEQDADIVCFVHRPYMVEESVTDDHIELITRKNRFGTPNRANVLIFNGKNQRITDKEEIGMYD